MVALAIAIALRVDGLDKLIEYLAWSLAAEKWRDARSDGYHYVTHHCTGLCPLISTNMGLPQDIALIMLAKINVLPCFEEQYRWNPWTEEGKEQRIAFCCEQAKLLLLEGSWI